MQKANTLSHDRLQIQCHMYLWNEYPNLRYLFHTNFNDIKIIERIIGALHKNKVSDVVRRVVLSQLKSIGLVKGTWDMEFLYNGKMYYFECKVGNDKLSPDQIAFKEINALHGACFFEFHSLDEFKTIVLNIIK